MPSISGMKGSGFYDRHSSAQLASIQILEDWLEAAVASVALPRARLPVTVLDLGSSEGRNAVHVMARIAAGLRTRTCQPVQTIYSDLGSNNFGQLFANLEDARCSSSEPAHVYPGVVAGSFYCQLLPKGTVHIATCFNAIHWLDRLPSLPVPAGVVYRRPRPGHPGQLPAAQVTAAFAQQAEQDLVRFLECRARELAPGGKLLLATPGDTDDASVSDGISDVLADACQDMLAAGKLRQDQYERLTLPVYFRTLSELLAPLKQADSPLHRAFSIERAEALESPTPFVVKFRRDQDAVDYASAYTGFLRAIWEPVVRKAFDEPATGEAAAVRELFERIRVRVQAEPERYMWRYILVATLLTRR